MSRLVAWNLNLKNFKDSVSRTNFYDMIMPLQANIIQDGFAAQNINIDLGTAELLASMFTSTPARLAAVAAEIGIPSRVAQEVTTRLGKKELKKYKAFREKKLLDLDGKEVPKDFDKNLKLMTDLTKESDLHPPKLLKYFGWDNETLFAVKIKENNVPILWLDDKWHYFFSNQKHVPQKVILCHAINKDFDTVWRVMDA